MRRLLTWLHRLLCPQPRYNSPAEVLEMLNYLTTLRVGATPVTFIDIPLSWPLYPMLPVIRRDGNLFIDDDIGVVFADGGLVVTTVFIVNMLDLGTRGLEELREDPTVLKLQYASVRDLARDWLPG